MGSKVVADTFVSYFPQILSCGESVKENLEKTLENPTVRAAFKEFASSHSDLVNKSPLLHRAAYHADSLQSSAFAYFFLKINEYYSGNFEADIRLIEDILFLRVIHPSDFAVTPSQLQHVMSLHEAGLIDSKRLIEFFSKQDRQGYTLLDYAVHFSTVLPWLTKLASNDSKALVQLLSIQNQFGNTPLHHWLVLEKAQEWLTSLARDNPDLFVALLSITNKSENTPLYYESIFIKAQSWLHRLANRHLESLVNCLLIKGKAGRTPLHSQSNFKTAWPLLETIGAKDQAQFVKLLSAQDSNGQTPLHCTQNLVSVKPLLLPIAQTQPQLFTSLLSIRDQYGMTPFDRLDFLKEAFFEFSDLLLNYTSSTNEIFSGEYPSDNDLESLLIFAGELAHSPQLSEEQLHWLHSLAKTNQGLLIKALSLCQDADHSVLDNRENFKRLMPLLIDLAEKDPELFLKVTSTRWQHSAQISDNRTHSLFEKFDFLLTAIPLLLILIKKNSFDVLNKVLPATVASAFEKLSQIVPVQKEVVNLFRGLLYIPLETAAIKEIARCALNILPPDDYDFDLAKTLAETNLRNPNSTFEIYKRQIAWQKEPCTADLPQTLIGSSQAYISTTGLIRASQTKCITREMIPPAATLENWDRLRFSLRDSIAKMPTKRDAYNDFDSLWVKCLDHPHFKNCLDFGEAKEIPPKKAFWAAVLNFILSHDDTPPPSPQEKLYLVAKSFVNDSTGEHENAETQYQQCLKALYDDLPPEFKLSLEDLVNREKIPRAATVENWNLLKESLRDSMAKTPTSSDRDFDLLWKNFLNNSFFQECLNFDNAREIPLYKAHWAAILKWILAPALSPRQEELYLRAQAFVHCDIGKDENIEAQNSQLPPGFKVDMDTLGNAAQTSARSEIFSFLKLHEIIMKLINSYEVLDDLTNGTGRAQATHNVRYIKNSLGPMLGLGPTIEYDKLPHEIAKPLLKMGRDQLLVRCLHHFNLRELVDKLITATENEPRSKEWGVVTFNDHIRSLITTSSAFWEYDENDLAVRLNKLGALVLLRIIGLVETSEPPVLINCTSPFNDVLKMPTECSEEPFIWTQNEGIAFQCEKIKETIPRLVADRDTHGKMQSLQTWIRHSDALELQIKDDWIREDQHLRASIVSNWSECSTELQIAILASWNHWDDEVKGNLRTEWKKCAPEIREEILKAWGKESETSLDELLSQWETANEVQRTQAIQFLDQKENLQAKWKTCTPEIREEILTAWEMNIDTSPDDFITRWDAATEKQKALVIQLLNLTVFDLQQPLMARWESCSPMVKREIIKLIPEKYNAQFTQEWDSVFASVAEHYKEPIIHFVDDLFIPNHPLSLVTFLEQKPQIIELLVPSNHRLLRKEIGTTLTDLVGKRILDLLESSSEPYVLEAARHLVTLLPPDKSRELKVKIDSLA